MQTIGQAAKVTDGLDLSWQDALPGELEQPCPATGPESPLPMLTAEAVLPITSKQRAAVLWVVGAHGGAGESTLAGLCPDWAAAEHCWPRTPDQPWCVLAARTSASGLLAAQAALRQWAAGDAGVRLAGLVLLADAPGKLPRALHDLAQLIAAGAPRCWLLPWIERWRYGEHHVTRGADRLIRELTAVTDTMRRFT